MATSVAPDRRAAIVCSHVAVHRAPILLAVRDEPLVGEDSGWQLLCSGEVDHEHEDSGTAQVWLVEEVLRIEPTLATLMDLPPGTVLVRVNATSAWRIS